MKHYAKWDVQRQDRIKGLMQTVHSGTFLAKRKRPPQLCDDGRIYGAGGGT